MYHSSTYPLLPCQSLSTFDRPPHSPSIDDIIYELSLVKILGYVSGEGMFYAKELQIALTNDKLHRLRHINLFTVFLSSFCIFFFLHRTSLLLNSKLFENLLIQIINRFSNKKNAIKIITFTKG